MATATSAWAKPGAWALESEEHAIMEKEKLSSAFPSLNPADSEPSADFPTLSAAVSKSSKKKKKPQAVSLAEFSVGKPVSHGAGARSRPEVLPTFSSKRLTSDELLILPTGPRERTAEELERSSRGFGYSSYTGGSRRMDGPVSRDSGDESRRNSLNKDSGPSRADEADDWASTKRSAGPSERRERGGGFFDSQSRADEVDSWISKRNIAPPSDGGRRMDGGGFDGMREKRGGFEMFNKDRSAADGGDSETWARKSPEVNRTDSDTWARRRDDLPRSDSDNWGRKKEEVNGTGGERPRLVLQPRSLPLSGGNADGNGEAHQGEKHVPVINSRSFNPFGLARPREEVLAEKGHDWKKLDETLESIKTMDGISVGKKAPAWGNGNLLDDRTEKSWRKEHTSAAPALMSGFSSLPVF
ncbi:hypothetical protein KSP40_PGU019136 [Platanthera guangdongensis]|uniref:Eukaryotic translation initiation factor 4B3-like n=1 Tax=Platanthera guangdongensis TaxID=2320717 RepID=A0ABR2LZ99_9ASPA